MESILLITQPWNDDRLKIGKYYVGCVTKENADAVMAFQRDATKWREQEAVINAMEKGLPT